MQTVFLVHTVRLPTGDAGKGGPKSQKESQKDIDVPSMVIDCDVNTFRFSSASHEPAPPLGTSLFWSWMLHSMKGQSRRRAARAVIVHLLEEGREDEEQACGESIDCRGLRDYKDRGRRSEDLRWGS